MFERVIETKQIFTNFYQRKSKDKGTGNRSKIIVAKNENVLFFLYARF